MVANERMIASAFGCKASSIGADEGLAAATVANAGLMSGSWLCGAAFAAFTRPAASCRSTCIGMPAASVAVSSGGSALLWTWLI